MQDIDFDELDRAVSSLIGDAPAAKKDDNKPTEAISVSVNTAPAPVPEPVVAPTASVATPIAVNVAVNATTPTPSVITAPTPTPPPAPSNIVSNRPNLGRSMDMVRPIGTNAATITTVKPASLPNPSEATSRKSMVVNPISLTELPPTNNPADRNAPIPVTPIGGAVLDSAPIVNNQQESPFIPDVKVDKRPLGGSIEPDMPELTKEQPPVYASAITPGGFINDKAEISTDMPLPAELQNKLLEIESAESSNMATAPVIPETPLAPVIPATQIADIPVVEPVIPSTPVIEQPVAAPSPVVTSPVASAAPQTGTIPPTSISQQYANTTADDVNLKTTGAIYDTSAFSNKSNIKPAKKKSNAWVWILSVVLILIAVAVGIAIYFVVR